MFDIDDPAFAALTTGEVGMGTKTGGRPVAEFTGIVLSEAQEAYLLSELDALDLEQYGYTINMDSGIPAGGFLWHDNHLLVQWDEFVDVNGDGDVIDDGGGVTILLKGDWEANFAGFVDKVESEILRRVA